MDIVTHNGQECTWVATNYNNNNNKAIQLLCLEGPYATATLNHEAIDVADDEVVIKEYSGNEGMVNALADAGIIELIPNRVYANDFVTMPVHKLTLNAMKRWEK